MEIYDCNSIAISVISCKKIYKWIATLHQTV
jgi:hypothetical protein